MKRSDISRKTKDILSSSFSPFFPYTLSFILFLPLSFRARTRSLSHTRLVSSHRRAFDLRLSSPSIGPPLRRPTVNTRNVNTQERIEDRTRYAKTVSQRKTAFFFLFSVNASSTETKLN